MALAALEVQGLSVTYPSGQAALRDVSFSLAAEERTALLGPNGAGKSTLLWRLVGVLEGKGRVTVGGVALAPQSRTQVRRMLGLAFAEPEDQLFMPTVERDVTFGLLAAGTPPEEANRIAVRAAAQVALGEHVLARAPYELSSGERRRAALACVLALDPVVLALDEPTNSLDARSRASLARTLLGLPCAQLIATHDLAFARVTCARALVLSRGELVADRPMAELLADPEALEEYELTARLGAEDESAILL